MLFNLGTTKINLRSTDFEICVLLFVVDVTVLVLQWVINFRLFHYINFILLIEIYYLDKDVISSFCLNIFILVHLLLKSESHFCYEQHASYVNTYLNQRMLSGIFKKTLLTSLQRCYIFSTSPGSMILQR
jgi:hypothetical protein